MKRESINGVARWGGAALTLTFLGLLVWQAFEAGPPGVPSKSQEGASVKISSLLNPEVRWSEMYLSSNMAKVAVPAAPVPPARAQHVVLAKDEIEVCGVGGMKVNAKGELLHPELMDNSIKNARERLVATLINSPNEVTRAAGLAFKSYQAQVVPVTASCQGADCPPKATAGTSAPKQGVPAVVVKPLNAAREELARLAAASASPQVYAMALRACNSQPDEGSCAMLSPDQWARLDPSNAVSWMRVAEAAKKRGDAAALDEAHFRMAHASKVESHWGQLTGVAQANLPAEMPSAIKADVLIDIMGIDSAMALPSYSVASQYCSATNVRDANRQQVCAMLAEMLTTKGSNLIDLSAGTRIGERAGWSAERVAVLSEERDALMQIGNRSLPKTRNIWSCEAVQQVTQHVADLGRYGELGSLRQSLKQSGMPVASLARRYRETYAQAAAMAASAASAAAANLASPPALASIQ